jgi:hypothetical protein
MSNEQESSLDEFFILGARFEAERRWVVEVEGEVVGREAK